MKKCCIMGGAGFIGSRLVPLLLGSGREVTVVGRKSTPQRKLPDGVRYVRGNCKSEEFTRKLIKDMDEIVYLAYTTIPGTSFVHPLRDIVSNLPAVVACLRAAAREGVGRFVLVSSGGAVYGQALELPISEEHPTNPICPYGITKLASEKYALAYHETEKLPVVIIRPGNAYGEGQLPYTGQGFIATAMASIIQGRTICLFGTREVIRDFINVQDLALGIQALLDRGKTGACYNLGTGQGRSIKEVLEHIMKLARHDGLEATVSYEKTRAFDVSHNVLSIQRIRRDVEWMPAIPFDSGLKSAWNWVKSFCAQNACVIP